MSKYLEKQQEIINLTAKLASDTSSIGDWKFSKCYEYSLTGRELPYDVEDLHAKRQVIRDQINAIQEELKTLPQDEDEGEDEEEQLG